MGSFCSKFCFCSDCCRESDKRESIAKDIAIREKIENKRQSNQIIDNEVRNEMIDRNIRDVLIDGNSDRLSVIVSGVDTDYSQTEQLLINDERLITELKKFHKRDDNTYDKLVIHEKSLPIDNYDKNGLIRRDSREFESVSRFMLVRGYELKEAIASGNYSEVYSGFAKDKKIKVAVKVIDTTTANQRYGLNFKSRETGIIGKLRHKNIVNVYEMLRTKDKIYVTMELATKGTIAQMLSKSGAFTEFMAWLLFRSIVEGLDHMHLHKIAHRNLKLENILLSECLNPKLSDFCYAKTLNNEALRNTDFSVSISYMAPEVLQQMPYNPFVSDIWSLGVCLYIMLNDCFPFTGERIIEVIDKQMNREWSHTKSIVQPISEDLKILFRILFDPDIDLRATTKMLLRHDWITSEPLS